MKDRVEQQRLMLPCLLHAPGAPIGDSERHQLGAEALLPVEWLQELELCEVIEHLANDLHAPLLAEKEVDRVDYPPN